MKMSRHVKYISDPLYGFIEVDVTILDGILLDIIDSPEFQRMRYIRQTGMSFFAYPTAHHTRFEHSLGVYSLAREFLNKMPEQEFDNESKDLFLIVSLIHDIGHAAFSHDFETMIESICRERSLDIEPYRHEDWLVKIISSSESILNNILYEKYGIGDEVKSFVYSIYKDEIRCSEDNDLHVLRESWLPLIRLLSSELDIDRLDYLLRDSYFTGVASGVYDFERIKRALVYNSRFKRFVIREKDIPAIEGFFIARYHMYRLVYNHKTTLSARTLFWKLFLRAWDLYQEGKLDDDYLIKPIYALFEYHMNPPVSSYVEITDPLVITQIKIWSQHSDDILKDLSTRFLTRRLFKPVPVKSSLPPYILDKIREIVYENGFEPEYYFEYVPNTVPRYIQLRYDALPEVFSEGGVLVEEHKKDITEVSDIIHTLTSPKQIIKGFIMVPTDDIRETVNNLINK